jgi:phosphatidylglycerol---prolipoprotein diacylglyceryl transferase
VHPILYRIGGFTIYSYGFFIAVGFGFGFALAVRRARREGISFEIVVELLFSCLLASLIGSRLLYVLTDLAFFRRHPLKVFNLWEGGLVFYGGFVLAVAVSVVYLKARRMRIWKTADLFSPPIALGLFFGRIGCFFAGCCYGTRTDLPWAVVFTNPDSLAPLNVPLHPAQLYDAANGLFIFFVLIAMKRRKAFDGGGFWVLIFLYAVTRFIVEMFRGDPRGTFPAFGLSTSQGIGVLLALTSLCMLFYLKTESRR